MLGDYLQKNPEAFVVAAGFADSAGDDEYNLSLSKRRATNVKNYLVSTFNIDMNRVVPLWFGELNPVADNATDEGTTTQPAGRNCCGSWRGKLVLDLLER